MESSDQSQDLQGSERRNSFGVYLKRFRTSLKKQPSTKSMKVNTTSSAPTDVSRSPESASPRSQKPLVDAEYRSNNVQQICPSVAPPNNESLGVDRPRSSDNSPTLRRETRSLSVNGDEKHAQSSANQYESRLEEEDRQLYNRAASMERVGKTPQMRVHHYCHECQGALGSDGLCVKCEHRRCSMCLRVPQRKEKSHDRSRNKSLETSPTSPISSMEPSHPPPADARTFSYRPRQLPDTATISSTQKIRWICHECSGFLILDERECQNCSHMKCSKCLRYPARTAASSAEQPSNGHLRKSHSESQVHERTYRRPRIRVKYTCEKCTTLFVENNKTCEKCGHIRCSNCPRQPPRRGEVHKPDPAVLRAVENKLAPCAMIEPPGHGHAVNAT